MNVSNAVAPWILGTISDSAGIEVTLWITVGISILAAVINFPLTWTKELKKKPKVDYQKAMEGMVQAGIGPWRVYTFGPENCTDLTLYGKPASFSMKLCMAWTGSMFWEIVQPLDGPSIYKDFLDKHGEGIHQGHVGFDVRIILSDLVIHPVPEYHGIIQ